jgi:cytochrome c-type biogenesis protein
VTVLASLAGTVTDGSLLLALPVAAAAGLVSFLSPCVLPLVPGYVSYTTGLVGADLGEARRGRVLAGTCLFVLGFTVVFVSFGALFGGLGAWLLTHTLTIQRVLGIMTIVMGLAFMGLLPGSAREWRIHRAPTLGLAGAPLLGILFGLGWTPCIGPTLAAVQTLALTQASALRGAILTAAYCIGLGLPFIAVGLGLRRAADSVGWVKRHYPLVMGLGGALLVTLGVLLLTGVWNSWSDDLRSWVAGYQVSI